MELSARLSTVANLVPRGARFADIGTDHALLPAWLMERGIIDRAIAADLRPGPLESARRTAERCGLTERMDFRLCNGLDGLSSGEANVIAIAGMGGETIAHILQAAPWVREDQIKLLLQPMSSIPELREWLTTHGFDILRERLAQEGRNLYVILEVEAGMPEPLTPAELWVGRQCSDPLRGAYLEQAMEKVSRALIGLRSASQPNEEAILYMTRVLTGIKQMREEWAI